MQIQLLPSTFGETGKASARQHLSCFVIDECVAIDAGSLAMAATEAHRKQIRNVVLTHAHLDHIAGLPLFIDDLFAILHEPVRVFGTQDVIDVLEKDIFNWRVYPRFSELNNTFGAVMKYSPFQVGKEFNVQHLRFKAINVNHKVPAVGFVISDGKSTIALTSDTAEMTGFWDEVNQVNNLDAVLVECAFPDELNDLAGVSHHLTPKSLSKELKKLDQSCPVMVINLKPMYREAIIQQLDKLGIDRMDILEIGKKYTW